MAQHPAVRRIGSSGLDLAVREWSPAGAPAAHVVLVHGYPDSQDMWEPMVERLPRDELHLVTYDVRGAGASGVPPRTSGYRSELLVEDLVAVVRATVPAGERFHLVGHDWGSVQLWDVVAAEREDPRLRGRVASFTSVSGPSLDHASWLLRRPKGRHRRLLRQLAHSWYVFLFLVPVLPELVWRTAQRPLRATIRRLDGAAHFGADLPGNGARGVNLYRANVGRLRTKRRLQTDVPVQVVHPEHDPFLTDLMLEDLDAACSRLTVARIRAGHWVAQSHPAELAALVTGFVRAHP